MQHPAAVSKSLGRSQVRNRAGREAQGLSPTGTGHMGLRSYLTSQAPQNSPMTTWPGFSQGFGHGLLRADPTAGQVWCCHQHHTCIMFNPNAKRKGKQDVFWSRTSISTKIICKWIYHIFWLHLNISPKYFHFGTTVCSQWSCYHSIAEQNF